MMRAFTCLLVLSVSCAPEAPPPSDPLPKEKFQELLLEAQLLEATHSFDLARLGTDSLLLHRYDSLFTAHGTTADRFRRTFDHWSKRPEELKTIYEAIVVELDKRKNEGR